MKEYIEREALKEVVSNLRFGPHLNKDAALNLMDRAIDNLPAADVVERKRGRWEEKEFMYGDVYYDCSVCGESFCLIDGTPTDNLYNFCPNCGADMREVDHA